MSGSAHKRIIDPTLGDGGGCEEGGRCSHIGDDKENTSARGNTRQGLTD